MSAEQLIREGSPVEALAALEKEVRANPASADLRVFLFQLLAVLGQWDRALTQLNVAADMDPKNLLMAHVCRSALQCEAYREQVFAGERSPLVFGEPSAWIGELIQAMSLTAKGQHGPAAELRARALEAAPTQEGRLNGQPFEWLADADSRLGPVLELIVDGRYYWAPFASISRIEVEAPSDLRDLVWTPAKVTWSNQGASVALIPTRYAPLPTKGELRLAHGTEWEDLGSHCWAGLGQRMLATSESETPLLEVREIELAPVASDAALGP